MMTRGGEWGKKCQKFDDVICEQSKLSFNVVTIFMLRFAEFLLRLT